MNWLGHRLVPMSRALGEYDTQRTVWRCLLCVESWDGLPDDSDVCTGEVCAA